MFRSARWFTKNGHVVEYEWAKDEGMGAMEAAMACFTASGDVVGRVQAVYRRFDANLTRLQLQRQILGVVPRLVEISAVKP